MGMLKSCDDDNYCTINKIATFHQTLNTQNQNSLKKKCTAFKLEIQLQIR